MSDDNQEYAGACYCGDVTVNVVGPSVMAGYCHCHSCRKWHAAPVNAWSGFPKDKVQINGATVTSMGKGTSRRISCASCGGAVANELAEYDVVVVYPMTLAGSGFRSAGSNIGAGEGS